MLSHVITIAKGVIKNRQMLLALEFALKENHPATFELYELKLKELRKDDEKDFKALDDLLLSVTKKPTLVQEN